MRKVLKIVTFWVGVDVLGFPNIINHQYEDFEVSKSKYEVKNSKYFKAFSKK